jgi:hypothetical protein
MRTSLSLAGDLDDVDFVHDVEQAFDIQFPDDVWSCETVGDLFALVVARLPGQDGTSGRCASAMCFHRLRRAVLTLAPHLELRPSTPIGVLRFVPVERLYHAIRSSGNLRTPPPYLSAWGVCGLLLAVAAPFGSPLLGVPWWAAISAVVPCLLAAAVLVWFLPGRLPPDVETVGDLVERLTALNIGRLAAHGARLGPTEAWETLRTLCEDLAGSRGGEIGAGTLLLQPRKAAA